tara:strand:+ start:472 stop:708 length:237 start_codon:yes stop_codon:yes gene_type:complete
MELLYKLNEGNLIINLGIELLLLSVVLVNFRAMLTADIESQSVKEIQRKRLFCREFISNIYCIVWKINSKPTTLKLEI